jgi:signal transduction histidine kinase
MVVVVIILLVVIVGLLLRLRSLSESLSAERKSALMKSVFASNMNHEVRTYLHSVSGLAETIAKEDVFLSKDEKKTISSQIKFNTSLITTLIEELAAVSENSEGHKAEDEQFSPNALCVRCIETNRSRVHEGVSIWFRRELEDTFLLVSDPHIVELLLNKLVVSACRFTRKGEIVVGCNKSDSDGLFTFYVQDTGAGIPLDRRNHMFSWFEKPSDMNDVVELDLSIAQRLALRVGGYLRYDEYYQLGTRMILVLPLKEPVLPLG